MSVTVEILDNADGTGGVAGLVNTASGDIVLYCMPRAGATTWTTLGTLAAAPSPPTSGELPFTLTTGVYWFFAIGGGVPSDPVLAAITNGADPIHKRIMDGVCDAIKSLSLTGIDNTSIVVRKTPDGRGLTLPAIVVAPGSNETSTQNAGTNNRDDVGYPVVVAIFAQDNRDYTTNHARYLQWRETIAKAFRNQRLTGVSEVMRCNVEQGSVIDQRAFYENYLASFFTLRFIARVPRGV